MLMHTAALDLTDENFNILLFHPGWVKTNMEGEHAPLTTAERVSGLRQIIEHHREYQTGQFYDWQGKARPW